MTSAQPPTPEHADARWLALTAWASQQLGQQVSLAPASADASFRRYFRCQAQRADGEQSLILMDAPPEQEDSRPFVDVAARLQRAGVAVPEIIAVDLQQGFMLLSDLGRQTWLEALNDDNAAAWFSEAIDTLIRVQQADAQGLPAYDEALLRRELGLFPEWYLGRHLGLAQDTALHAALSEVNDLLVARALAQPRVFVHRDFMPRNLMVSEPNPGVLDFQDAVYGPISYDPICLFKDAFLSWPEARVQGWLSDYHARARDAGLPVTADLAEFLEDCDLMGAHRHLKVIGIFARICHRDGKPKYLADVPRFMAYLRTVIARRPALAPLGEVLDRVAAVDAS
ncbi:phosphotransferase [Alcanivorax sp. JB21]|uniref:aminoglycoside phosphotransferase family protein n=1 Tax=Alcanivorax limicola TaxID=2874102 RepID=UPI002958D7FA|nr:phosphotransferase [Alcanivorax limicola]MBZ2190076.1 phosphotransferase [Alcanivorax limicola]